MGIQIPCLAKEFLFCLKVEYEHFCNDGRKLIANVKINDINYTIINLYAPANVTERQDFS